MEKAISIQSWQEKIWLTEESAARRDLKQISKEPKSEKALNPIIADWNSKDSLFRWRESWARMCNQALKENNINEYIAYAYERLALSAAVSSSQNQIKDEAVIAKAYADSMAQITAALENFMKSLDFKKQELEVCSPF